MSEQNFYLQIWTRAHVRYDVGVYHNLSYVEVNFVGGKLHFYMIHLTKLEVVQIGCFVVRFRVRDVNTIRLLRIELHSIMAFGINNCYEF